MIRPTLDCSSGLNAKLSSAERAEKLSRAAFWRTTDSYDDKMMHLLLVAVLALSGFGSVETL